MLAAFRSAFPRGGSKLYSKVNDALTNDTESCLAILKAPPMRLRAGEREQDAPRQSSARHCEINHAVVFILQNVGNRLF